MGSNLKVFPHALPVESVGTSQLESFRHEDGFTSYSGFLPGVKSYAYVVDIPQSNVSAGLYVIPALEPLDLLVLGFALTDGGIKTASGRLWGLKPIRRYGSGSSGGSQEFLGCYLGDLSITAATNASPGSGSSVFDEGNVFLADSITFSPDNTPGPGVRFVGGSDSPQLCYLDSFSFPYFILALKVGTAASVCPIWFQM